MRDQADALEADGPMGKVLGPLFEAGSVSSSFQSMGRTAFNAISTGNSVTGDNSFAIFEADILIVSGTNEVALWANSADGATYRRITVFKHGTMGQSDVANNIGGSGVTTITGGKVKTGQIESTNFSTTAGSQIDLDNGTIQLGGSADPTFKVDSSGFVFAGNFTERFISVNDSNASEYLRDVTGGKQLVFDGSEGGDVVMNMELSMSSGFIIKSISLPITGSDKNTVKVYIAQEGVQYDDGALINSYSSFNATAYNYAPKNTQN